MAGGRAALKADLREHVRGEVRFDAGSRALYASTGSNYRLVPIGVVVPEDADDVAAAVDVCRRHGAPALPRGGGTSLAGQAANVAVVVDCSKRMRRILELDPERRIARVEPGVVLDDLRAAAERHGLTFGPDPSTHAYCTLGGMIGNNACGVHSVMAGKTDDNVEALEILTYRGERLRVGGGDDRLPDELRGRLTQLRDRYADRIRGRYPDIPRRVSGYNLDRLLPERGFHVARSLVGSEGTCVTVLEATLRLVASPPARTLVVLGYPDVYAAADDVMRVLEFGPIGLEGIDRLLHDNMEAKGLHAGELGLLPPGHGWLLVEFGGETREEADERANELIASLDGARAKLYDDRAQEQKVWEIREAGLGATARVPGQPDTWEGWEDAAVPPERLGDYLRDFHALLKRHGYFGALYGHFGQGCIHTRINFDFRTARGIAAYRSFVEEAADLVVSYGGSLSGEHGDGESRAELLPRMFGAELVEAFREFKAIWDPDGRMNPGKVVDAYRIDENLRFGVDYRPSLPTTHFRFPSDDGSFVRAAERCVGVGKCRRTGGGVMCPSYMVTLEEMHSTRGRARLLWEMLRGDLVSGGWRDEHVKEALDLCLACKGCKGDCPVNVDVATYKAEFLSHYYARRLRPRSAYAMGLIHWWARLASRAPGLANLGARIPVAKTAAGIAPERQLPRFAPTTFRAWFGRRDARGDGPRILLWPDTFTDHFHPEIGVAAVESLEALGFRVELPAGRLCCGRPLYDFGMLTTAKWLLRRALRTLRDAAAAGVPIVALEPSCAAVFRDELLQLFPDNPDAERVSSQVLLLSEFLEREAGERELPRLERKALVHGHCHQKAVMGVEADRAVLRRLGVAFELLDSGCCGMAGSFGFERGEHYEVSIRAGERVLLPRIRGAADDELVIADGFSCREQIAQGTDRRALHLSQVLQMALREGPRGPSTGRPETAYLEPPHVDGHRGRAAVSVAALAAGVGVVALRR